MWAAFEFPAPGDKEEASWEEINVSASVVTSLALFLPCLAVAEQSSLYCL